MHRYRRTGIVAIVVGVALAPAVDGFATVGPGLRTYTRNVTAQDLLRAGSGAPRGVWTLRSKAHALSLDAKGQGLVPERASWTASTVVVSDNARVDLYLLRRERQRHIPLDEHWLAADIQAREGPLQRSCRSPRRSLEAIGLRVRRAST